MKLITNDDLGFAEQILATDGLPNTLRVRDPNRFPELVPMVEALLERDITNGHLYAYLIDRFAGHLNCLVWQALSRGPGGRLTRELLARIEEARRSDLWLLTLNRLLPGELPARERVFIAWLRGELPAEVIAHPGPHHGRLVEPVQPFRDTMTSDVRGMFRRKKS